MEFTSSILYFNNLLSPQIQKRYIRANYRLADFPSNHRLIFQVWAIGVPDQRVYYRSGVTPSELTGRSWRPVNAPIQLSRHSTQSNSLLSLGHSSGTEETEWDDEGK